MRPWDRSAAKAAVLGSELEPTRRFVALVLCELANDAGTYRGRNAALVDATGHSERTVRRALADLEAAGFVQRIARGPREVWRQVLVGAVPVTVATHPPVEASQGDQPRPAFTGWTHGLGDSDFDDDDFDCDGIDPRTLPRRGPLAPVPPSEHRAAVLPLLTRWWEGRGTPGINPSPTHPLVLAAARDLALSSVTPREWRALSHHQRHCDVAAWLAGVSA